MGGMGGLLENIKSDYGACDDISSINNRKINITVVIRCKISIVLSSSFYLSATRRH